MYSFDKRSALITGLIVFGIMAGSSYFLMLFRDRAVEERVKIQVAKQVEKQVAERQKADANAVGRPPEVKREDPAIQEERRARAQARLLEIRSLQIGISEALDKLDKEVIAWDTRIPELMKGNEGKKIAASKLRVEQFASIIEKDHISKSRVQALRGRLETLIKPVDRALLDADSSYFVSETLLSDIEKIGEEARLRLREIGEMKAIVVALNADSANSTPSEKTLQTAIDDLNADQLRKRAELIAKTKSDVYDFESKRLAAAEAKAEQDLANARLVLSKAKADAEKQGIDLQTDDTKRRTDDAKTAENRRVEKAKREAKFDVEYPSMRAYLLPITSPGFKQFDGDGGPRLSMGTTKGPMSLAALTGALRKGRDETGNFARAISNWSDRPQGSFPFYSTGGAGQTPQNFEIWYRIQDFVAEFGDIMVERKLLAP